MPNDPLERREIPEHLDGLLRIQVDPEFFLERGDQNHVLYGIPALQARGGRLVLDLLEGNLQERRKQL